MYEYEQEAYAQGFRAVCGVDEAGRGPLAKCEQDRPLLRCAGEAGFFTGAAEVL